MRVNCGRWRRCWTPGAAAAGRSDRCWTLTRIVEVVHRRFRVEHTLAGMHLLLHRIGWCAQVPSARASGPATGEPPRRVTDRRMTAPSPSPSPSLRLLPRAPSQPALQRTVRHLCRCDPYPICRRHRS
ncbi:winged helix-turn-helix domain-containing protein [Streptomyces sp. CB01635]|uniref:helix-turn-helix domain-containing protein n=1 Tax=Streptomyces sp. NPDC000188 TaxID=3154245 RepID=UPI002D791462|nr:winged helix-turn-helix domain-containing protein [Streptomyces sp. CB01635]